MFIRVYLCPSVVKNFIAEAIMLYFVYFSLAQGAEGTEFLFCNFFIIFFKKDFYLFCTSCLCVEKFPPVPSAPLREKSPPVPLCLCARNFPLFIKND